MPRDMSVAMLAAIQSQVIQPAIFLQAQFLSGIVYLWTGYGNISFNGQTWTGIGDMGSITAIEEGTDVQARGITLTLSGFNASLLANVLGEIQLGFPVIIYFGLFSAGVLIPTPITSWAGRMDQSTVDVSGDTATLSINCENRLVEMNTARNFRYTNDQQVLTYPADTAFTWIASIQARTIYWGRTPGSADNV